MARLMTKQELIDLLEEAVSLNVYKRSENSQHVSIAEMAQMVFEGSLSFDAEEISKKVETEKIRLKEEARKKTCRGGLSREALEDKIMQGIVNGALAIKYGQIAPYSHGYEITFGADGPPGSTYRFLNRWECYTDLFDVPKKIVDKIEEGKQDGVVFGAKCQPFDIQFMLEKIEEAENNKITSFTLAKDTDFQIAESPNRYPYRNSVASVMDVHQGKGLDGIVQHKFHGSYSTMTPVRQNSLVEALVCMKGFCLDAVHNLDLARGEIDKIIDYLKKHGTDISTPEKLDAWIKNNPDKCAYEANREMSQIKNESMKKLMDHAAQKAATVKQNNQHKNTKTMDDRIL